MLRIRSFADGMSATFALSGRLDDAALFEIQELLNFHVEVRQVTLDLEELRLVDREAVRFLAACEARGIKLKNCPPYIREWIGTGSGTGYEP